MEIEVWETEDPILIVLGTHDLELAYSHAKKFYEDAVGEVPEDLKEEIGSSLDSGSGLWVNPEVAYLEEERWPDFMMSTEPLEGWVPFISVLW